MIEITARQLYDIYRHLPNPDFAMHHSDFRGRYRVALEPDYTMVKREDMWSGFNAIPTAPIREIEFEVDINVRPYEWKPTTDLIIKA